MSLIPSISIGRKTSRSKFHIPSMTHGTSEIGYVYPSYSRNLINNSHFSISSRQAIRLSPLFVPTMGDLSLRTYHAFVPHNKVWTPFDAFLDKKPFAFPDGVSRVPRHIPGMKVGSAIRYLLGSYMMEDTFFNDLDSLRSNLVMSVYMDDPTLGGVPKLMSLADINRLFSPETVQTHIHGHSVSAKSYAFLSEYFTNNSLENAEGVTGLAVGIPSLLYAPQDSDPSNPWKGSFFTFNHDQGASGETIFSCVDIFNYDIYKNSNDVPDTVLYNRVKNHVNALAVPSYDACDFMVKKEVADGPSVISYYFCYNFNGAWKRLRSIFLGLGYCFNPFDSTYVTPLKLLAFYRAYWDLFGVNRNINFQDTNCAKFSRLISAIANGNINFRTGSDVFINFIIDLTHCTYTCPPDYFSASVENTQQGIIDSSGINISSPVGSLASQDSIQGVASPSDQTEPGAKNPLFGDNEISGLAVQMALRMLRFVNRYTVVGSKIYDSLNARFGHIDINDESSEGVKVIGQDSTNINIGAIFNQSDTNDGAPLGDFAGVGTGNGNSQKYSFEVSAFGTFVSLTVVVPQMGYFQGMLRENSDGFGDSYEMFDETFDAVGWQVVRTNELVADRQFECASGVGTNLGNFGFMPRYSHMKVGFNRCLGDISLPHLQNSMLPYTLDRFFGQRDIIPVNNSQWFRSGTRGDTNRIFQSVSPTDDHVIWQIYFDVTYDAPMKSISESFDTRLPDDNSSVDISHV